MWDVGFAAGEVVGTWLAPLAGAGSWLRQARLFHPEGVCYRGRVQPSDSATGPLSEAAARLGPRALVRLSSAWWRGGKEWPDALGVALRFQGEPGAPPTAEDQDLLLATIPVPLLTPLSPLWTNVHDFLDNRYYGVSPFTLAGVGSVRLRLRAREPAPPGPSRDERLAISAAQGEAVLILEVARGLLASWVPLIEVRLEQPLHLDQQALRFSPFRSGRGLQPRGFVHGLRRAVYPVSQALRPGASPR